MPRLIPADELAQTIAMFHAGVPAELMAVLLGVSERAVYQRLARRKLRFKRAATRKHVLAIQARQSLIAQLAGQLTMPELAARLCVRPRTLRAWMSRHMPEAYDQVKARLRAERAARGHPRASPPRCAEPGVPMPLTRWRRSQVKRAYLAGDTLAAIARRYRHHPSTIGRLLRRQGVRLRGRTEHLRGRRASDRPAGTPLC